MTRDKQIAIIGSQSTGKTTLANAYIKCIRDQGKNCKEYWITDDGCARSVAKRGGGINEDTNCSTQINIVRELVRKFKPCAQENGFRYSPYIMRVSTLVRIWAYMKYSIEHSRDWNNDDVASMAIFHEWALYELYFVFDEVIYLPIEFEPIEDGVRSTSKEYQVIIDGYLKDILEESGVYYHIIVGNRLSRLNQLRYIIRNTGV